MAEVQHVAGINNADLTAAQTATETSQVAQDIMSRAAAGTITIDPSVQGDIQSAAQPTAAPADAPAASAVA